MTFWRDARAQFHLSAGNLFLRIKGYGAAAHCYERVLRIRPDQRQVEFHRAWCLLEVPGRRTDAILGFQTLLKHSPSARGYDLLACGLQLESRHEEAVEAFREVLRLEASPAPVFFFNYAISLEAVRRFDEAVDAYRSAALLNPSDAEAWTSLGAMLFRLGRWKDAAPCQERARRLAPSVTHTLNLAWTLYELNRLDEAERMLCEAIGGDPQSADARGLLAHVLAGQGRYDEAIRMAREACETGCGVLSSPQAVLAGVLSEAGGLDEALRVAKAAADAAPHHASAHGVLGGVYLNMNDGVSALAAFARMAECLDPERDRLVSSPWMECLAGRGVALSLLGRHDQALTTFEELLRTDPGFVERWPDVAPHYQLSREAVLASESVPS